MGNDRYGGTLVFDEDDRLEPSVYCVLCIVPKRLSRCTGEETP